MPSGAPICSGTTKLPKAYARGTTPRKTMISRASRQAGYRTRKHDAARRLVNAEPVADERNRPARICQLKPHDHHQREAKQEKQEAGNRVLEPDHFVIEREHVLSPESQLLVVSSVVRMGCAVRRRQIQRPTPLSGLQPAAAIVRSKVQTAQAIAAWPGVCVRLIGELFRLRAKDCDDAARPDVRLAGERPRQPRVDRTARPCNNRTVQPRS